MQRAHAANAMQAFWSARVEQALIPGERANASYNTCRDLVLKFEDIRQVAVISLSPYVRAALNADQLGGNANLITCGTDTPFDDVVHLKFSTHLRDVNCHPFVGER